MSVVAASVPAMPSWSSMSLVRGRNAADAADALKSADADALAMLAALDVRAARAADAVAADVASLSAELEQIARLLPPRGLGPNGVPVGPQRDALAIIAGALFDADGRLGQLPRYGGQPITTARLSEIRRQYELRGTDVDEHTSAVRSWSLSVAASVVGVGSLAGTRAAEAVAAADAHAARMGSASRGGVPFAYGQLATSWTHVAALPASIAQSLTALN